MKYNDFDCFFKVMEVGSFTEAAQQLFMTQSALSQRIIALEKKLGAKLFDRNSSPIRLTYEGELYQKMAIQVIEAEKTLMHSLADIKDAKLGKISVAMTMMRSQQMLHFLVPRFKAQFPQVEFHLLHEHDNDLVDLVLSGKADVAFISRNTIHPELEYVPLAKSEIILCVPPRHPIAKEAQDIFNWNKRPAIDLRRVHHESFIMLDGYPHFSKQINRIFDDYQFAPNVYLKLADFYTAHQLSLSGGGFTLVYDSSAVQHYPKGTYFRLDKGPYYNELKLCYKKTHYLSKIMREFIALSKEVYHETFVERFIPE